jgi:hypothetical protein
VVISYSGPIPRKDDLTVISYLPGKMQYFYINRDGFGQTDVSYNTPGLYPVKIFSNNLQLASASVLVESEGWLKFIRSGGKEIPVSEKRRSQIQTKISKEKVVKVGLDTTKRFYTVFKNFKTFGIEGEQFTFETDVFNTQSTVEPRDELFTLKIRCENYPVILQFAKWIPRNGFFVQFSETIYDVPKRKRLVEFLLTSPGWQKIKVTSEDFKIKVWLNGKPIYEESYTKPLGPILGLEYDFAGAGEIRSSVISNNKRKIWNGVPGNSN